MHNQHNQNNQNTKLSFEELLKNLKVNSLYWYNDNIPDDIREHALSLLKLHTFFAKNDKHIMSVVENNILNLLILLRNSANETNL